MHPIELELAKAKELHRTAPSRLHPVTVKPERTRLELRISYLKSELNRLAVE